MGFNPFPIVFVFPIISVGEGGTSQKRQCPTVSAQVIIETEVALNGKYGTFTPNEWENPSWMIFC